MMDSAMMDGSGFGMGGGMFMGMFFWLVILIGFVALIVWSVQRSTGSNQSHSVESALDILKKRYAKGEIDKEEFEEKKRLVS